jgi:polar amino acid transport system substrate-binding protein
MNISPLPSLRLPVLLRLADLWAFRRAAVALVAGAGLLALTGCTAPGSAPKAPGAPTAAGGAGTTGSEPALRVGVCGKLAPIVSLQSGQYSGFEADFARGLGASLSRRVVFVELPWLELLPALQGGKVDIVMSGVSITPERMMVVDFANPYLRSGLAAVVRRDEISTLSMFFTRSIRIGVKPGTTGEYYVQQQFPQNKRIPFLNPGEAARALKEKKIDIFIIDAPIAWWMVGAYEADGIAVIGDLLNTEYLAWAVAKGNGPLHKAANDYVAATLKDGQQQAILRRWLGSHYAP